MFIFTEWNLRQFITFDCKWSVKSLVIANCLEINVLLHNDIKVKVLWTGYCVAEDSDKLFSKGVEAK